MPPAKLAAGNPTHVEAINMQGSRYIDFLIPGLLAYGMMSLNVYCCVWLNS